MNKPILAFFAALAAFSAHAQERQKTVTSQTALRDGGIYHSKSFDALACNDPKITAEIQDAADHPGRLSQGAFDKLADSGQCSPISPDVALTVVRTISFVVPAGPQSVAYVEMHNQSSGTQRFYILSKQLAAAKK